MEIKEFIEYCVIGFLGYNYIKQKYFNRRKSEYEVMALANNTWKEYTENLSNRVAQLTEEIAQLRNENNDLRLEIKKLETIIRNTNK